MCCDLKEIVSFEMKDYSGESLDKRDEVYHQIIKQSVEESTVLYIFIDGNSFCADSREERKENVYYDSAMTLRPMIQDFADAHGSILPPIVFVVTKVDLCKKYVTEQEIISVIKELFRPAFSKNTTSYICGVSFGSTISDDNYKGKLNPFNVHIPFFIGCYHEYYNRYGILRHDIDVANGNWSEEKDKINGYIDAQNRKWSIFRNQSLISHYRQQLSCIENGISHNQQLPETTKNVH